VDCLFFITVKWDLRDFFCLCQTLQAQVTNAAAGPLVPAGAVADSNRSVIDLTDDDDTSTRAATRPQMQTVPQFCLIAPSVNLLPQTTLPSTAVMKPMYPMQPPPLQIAPSAQSRFQVVACN